MMDKLLFIFLLSPNVLSKVTRFTLLTGCFPACQTTAAPGTFFYKSKKKDAKKNKKQTGIAPLR